MVNENFMKCMEEGKGPEQSKKKCVALLYDGKGDKMNVETIGEAVYSVFQEILIGIYK